APAPRPLPKSSWGALLLSMYSSKSARRCPSLKSRLSKYPPRGAQFSAANGTRTIRGIANMNRRTRPTVLRIRKIMYHASQIQKIVKPMREPDESTIKRLLQRYKYQQKLRGCMLKRARTEMAYRAYVFGS